MTLLGTTSIGGTVPPHVLGSPITSFSCILRKISYYMAYFLVGAHIPAFFSSVDDTIGHNIHWGHSASTGPRCPHYKLQLHIEENKLLHGLLVTRGTYSSIFSSVDDTIGHNICWGHSASTGRRCPHYKLQLHIKENKLLHVLLVRRVTYTSIFFFFSSSVDDTIGHNIYWGHSASTCPRFPHYKL